MTDLVVENISVLARESVLVDDASFRLGCGEFVALLGPNGAGKTTTLRMLLGIIDPDQGVRRIFGNDRPHEVAKLIGYLPEERGLYPAMKCDDAIAFMGALRGLPLAEGKARGRELLEGHGMGHAIDRQIRQLSKGMAQTVQLLGTLVHRPKLVVLDEPFSGLDAINQGKLETMIRELALGGTTVIFSTHVIHHAERLCDEVAIIAGGKVPYAGSVDVARDRIPAQVRLETRTGEGVWCSALPADTRHDVKARIEEFCALAGHEHIHKGMTSRDLTENVEQLQVKQSLALLRDRAVATLARLGRLAAEHETTVMAGRSHNVAAQATTLGKRFATAADEMLVSVERVEDLLARYPLRGIKGPMGTAQDMLDLLDGDADKLADLEQRVAAHLGFERVLTSVGQVYPRSLDFDVLSALVQLTAGPSNLATTIRLMAGNEIVTEGFKEGQVGSSAMPHKMNPRSCERVNGLAVVTRGYLSMVGELAGDRGRVLLGVRLRLGGLVLVPVGELRVVLAQHHRDPGAEDDVHVADVAGVLQRRPGGRVRALGGGRTGQQAVPGGHPGAQPGSDLVPGDGGRVEAALLAGALQHPRPVLGVAHDPVLPLTHGQQRGRRGCPVEIRCRTLVVSWRARASIVERPGGQSET